MRLVSWVTGLPLAVRVMAICCLWLAVLPWLPETWQPLGVAVPVTLLGLNLLICLLGRCRSLTGNRRRYSLPGWFIHLGLVLIILGGLASGGDAGQVVEFKQGQTLNLGDGLTVRAEEIKADFYPDGKVKQYFTTLAVLEDGTAARTLTVAVNHPVKHQGLKMYQSTYRETAEGKISGLLVKQASNLTPVWGGFGLLIGGLLFTTWRPK
ncbi:MAG: cytochrome c biogenesis protein ResB [Heliobacteriaceae bacterium]|nr:cytochrome c biogenesis protein ResB [Heliobacteriaceae bacterium]MDD4588094.1 cytochrome c biogenesis protein ResB [Heliobacteriaceae bacterium]